jgi:hypothetical protein
MKMSRACIAAVVTTAIACASRSGPGLEAAPAGTSNCAADLRSGSSAVRSALERQYLRNRNAFLAENLDSVMVLRSEDFSTELARAQVRQHLERMALRPGQQVHHVETWVVQRETWLCTAGEWKLHLVDQVRDQRRLVDSLPG